MCDQKDAKRCAASVLTLCWNLIFCQIWLVVPFRLNLYPQRKNERQINILATERERDRERERERVSAGCLIAFLSPQPGLPSCLHPKLAQIRNKKHVSHVRNNQRPIGDPSETSGMRARTHHLLGGHTGSASRDPGLALRQAVTILGGKSWLVGSWIFRNILNPRIFKLCAIGSFWWGNLEFGLLIFRIFQKHIHNQST